VLHLRQPRGGRHDLVAAVLVRARVGQPRVEAGLIALQHLDGRGQRVQFLALLVRQTCGPRRRCGRHGARGRRRLRGGNRSVRGRTLAHPVVVSARILADAAAGLERERAVHHVVQQLAVVADQEQRTLERQQQILEQLQRLQVEIVRRLVQHEHVGRPREETREQQAIALTAGEGADNRAGPLGGEEELLQIAHDVPPPAVDRDEVPAVRDVVEDGRLLVELAAQLVEVGDLQVRAVPDRAALRRQLAQQQAQQRRLARSVRAHDADLVPAHDRGGEPADDRPALVREGDVVRADDQLPRPLRLLHLHAEAAGVLPPLASLHPQALQRTDAALVARAAGLDALADPRFFLGQLLIELRLLRRLRVQYGLLARGEGIVVARPIDQPAAVDLDDARGQPPQERPVVGDEDQRAAVAQQVILQPGDGVEVQVVRRFVEQNDVGVAHEPLRQHDPPLEARGERREVRVAVELHAHEDRIQQQPALPVLGIVRALGDGLPAAGRGLQAPGDHLGHGAGDPLGHLLRQRRHVHPALAHQRAGVRLEVARDELEQGRLPHPVAPHQAEPFPALDLQVDVLQDELTPESEAHVPQAAQRHAHIPSPEMTAPIIPVFTRGRLTDGRGAVIVAPVAVRSTTEYARTFIQRGRGTGPMKPRQPTDYEYGANSGRHDLEDERKGAMVLPSPSCLTTRGIFMSRTRPSRRQVRGPFCAPCPASQHTVER